MVEVETLEVETLEELLSGQLGRLVIPKRGEVLEGAVVFSDKTGILVDVGGKSEALVSRREIPKGTDITLGEKVSILVVDPESPEGALIGSLKGARVERLWQHLSQAQKNGEVVEIEILDGVKSGLLVSFSGVKGFLPMSQTGRQVGEDLRDLHGTKALVKVLEVNKKRGRMVVFFESGYRRKEDSGTAGDSQGIECGRYRSRHGNGNYQLRGFYCIWWDGRTGAHIRDGLGKSGGRKGLCKRRR